MRHSTDTHQLHTTCQPRSTIVRQLSDYSCDDITLFIRAHYQDMNRSASIYARADQRPSTTLRLFKRAFLLPRRQSIQLLATDDGNGYCRSNLIVPKRHLKPFVLFYDIPFPCPYSCSPPPSSERNSEVLVLSSHNKNPRNNTARLFS